MICIDNLLVKMSRGSLKDEWKHAMLWVMDTMKVAARVVIPPMKSIHIGNIGTPKAGSNNSKPPEEFHVIIKYSSEKKKLSFSLFPQNIGNIFIFWFDWISVSIAFASLVLISSTALGWRRRKRQIGCVTRVQHAFAISQKLLKSVAWKLQITA